MSVAGGKKPEVQFDCWPRCRAASDERAAGFERPDTFLPGGWSNVLDDDVDTFEVSNLADFLRNLLLVVVDNEIGAEFAGALHFALVARGRNYARVEHLCDLDGGDSHS